MLYNFNHICYRVKTKTKLIVNAVRMENKKMLKLAVKGLYNNIIIIINYCTSVSFKKKKTYLN